jgi:FAD/FMN-containing dehydrogenase
MREYRQILDFSPANKEITVQSGITWRDIQERIDPHNLSVKIMQTYSNFTVGGSLSVNVHGRYVGLGPIISSVKRFNIVLADGRLVEASPTQNKDIFYSAIGGMGGLGVISEITLSLTDNVNVERSRTLVPTEQYYEYFKKNIQTNTKTIFHNGDIYPPSFNAVSAVSWSETSKTPTESTRLIPRDMDYWLERSAWIVMSEFPAGRWIRRHAIDPIFYSSENPVHSRNYEASYDTAELEPNKRSKSSYVLQEYFIPVERFDDWIPKMAAVFKSNDVNVINVSIRHSLADSSTKLAWAQKESFAFVVYYKQDTDEAARTQVAKWTREMIDEALSVGGSYYLPYQLHATVEQFYRAYPGAVDFFEIKGKYDPTNKFTNALWDKYYSTKQLQSYKEKQVRRKAAASIENYFRPYDNAYLSIPEWYIVYSADEYAAVLKSSLASQFDYTQAIQDYWTQHQLVLDLTASSTHNNDDYKTVLSVIGWSFTVENYIKNLYENNIGSASEWFANNMPVAEDQYAAKIATDYAELIYNHPWYDFPYAKYLQGLWTLEPHEHHTFGQNLRRLERKLILSLELAIKASYSSAIELVTHANFGVQDDVVYAIISRDGGTTTEVISGDHYQPFTRALLKDLQAEINNPLYSIIDISGNDKITLCYLDKSGSPAVKPATEIARDSEIQNISNGQPELIERITVEVKVNDIMSIYKQLQNKNINIQHFYDY